MFSNFTISFTLCLKNTWKEGRSERTLSTTLLAWFYIYSCLIAHLYCFITVYIGLGAGVVAIDTGFSGTRNLQVGVSPPLPENFFCSSVLEKLCWVSHEFFGTLHESLSSILNRIHMWKQITLRQLHRQRIKKHFHCLELWNLFKKDNGQANTLERR